MTSHFRYVLPLILAFAIAVLAVEKPVAEVQDSAIPFDPEARAKTVAPVVDELTRVVAHIDISRLQLGQLMATVERIVPPQAINARKISEDYLALRTILLKVGISDFYIVSTLEDFPPLPFFIVAPLAQDGRSFDEKIQELIDWRQNDGRDVVTRNPRIKIDRLGDLVFLGLPQTLKRLKKLKPTPRPQLAQTFAAAGDTDFQIVFLTNDDDRSVVEELYPTLPKWLGGGSSTIVTHGLRWAAVGVKFPSEPQLRMTIESKDNEAAQALNAKIAEVLPLLASGTIFMKKPDKQNPAADVLRLAAMIKPTVNGRRIEYTLGGNSEEAAALAKMLAVPLAESLEVIWRRQTMNKLRQLGLAMHNFHDGHKTFPAQANCDANGRPLLSWRVHILPYVEQNNLYKQFHLDEPWDSAHNRTLIEKMPEAYAMPNSSASHQGRTCFVRPVGENTVCPGKKAVAIKEITDGTSNTIMIVEVDEKYAVIWTKPDDIVVDPKHPAKGLGGHFKERFCATLCDGSVKVTKSTIDQQILNALFSRNGGEPVDHSKL